ncbi:hypothetical protein SDC9_06123 [bioreactor metagenome]|uniref:PRC-barrel domain-containing protein n=1 Tax=bioreactor metagenome TaxID=1076179 RepID=A0A644T2W6_9ZZZZ|nr:PRC-barrel domain-containing protein [Negativicutes bacterium]
MKKSVDIIGLPVFSIAQGREIGKVKRFVINAEKGAVTALVIDEGKWYLGAKLLPMSDVTAIGECAVTVDKIENILDIKDIPNIESLLEANIQVIGTNVLTNTGCMIGNIKEIILDESGAICSCEVEENNGEVLQVSAERILTYGKDVVIITNTDSVKSITVNSAKIEKAPDLAPIPQVAPVKTTPVDAVTAPRVQSDATDESAKKFDDRHRKYLLGKKASRKIETDNGMVIVEQGGEITEEVLQKAKLAGKFVELSMNIQ